MARNKRDSRSAGGRRPAGSALRQPGALPLTPRSSNKVIRLLKSGRWGGPGSDKVQHPRGWRELALLLGCALGAARLYPPWRKALVLWAGQARPRSHSPGQDPGHGLFWLARMGTGRGDLFKVILANALLQFQGGPGQRKQLLRAPRGRRSRPSPGTCAQPQPEHTRTPAQTRGQDTRNRPSEAQGDLSPADTAPVPSGSCFGVCVSAPNTQGLHQRRFPPSPPALQGPIPCAPHREHLAGVATTSQQRRIGCALATASAAEQPQQQCVLRGPL